MMTDEEVILAMAICDLLGQTFKREQVEDALQKARERFYRPPHAPRPAKQTYARRKIGQND
jgi:hypothetical protein